jgi:GR25 family glycosyltransferase involved in LPS biosynthesis
MSEKLLERFNNTGSISDAIQIVQECESSGYSTLGYELGKMFLEFFPPNVKLLSVTADCCFLIKNYSECYRLTDRISRYVTDDAEIFKANYNRSLCINQIADVHLSYNPEKVKDITGRKTSTTPMITFTITTCKRLDLFEKTINSFLNCCTDLHKIDTWLCVDDNSSEEDRKAMRTLYPFFEFYMKSPDEKGHPTSMNIIRSKVRTPYIFHMEDDWKFFAQKPYISMCLDVLGQDVLLGQCLVNRNYAETAKDCASIIGGIFKITTYGTRYFVHENCENDEQYENFYNRHGRGVNCAYWKHFSFRPSLLRKGVLDQLGEYSNMPNFEMDYSERYYRSGYRSAFLDSVYCLHTGRLTSERFDTTKSNAYVLNGERQFVENVDVDFPKKYNMKTYVINLDRRPDRWNNFSKLEEPKFLRYEKFSAVDGSKLTPNRQLQRIFEGNDYNMRDGMVGVALSHIKLWIDLINSDKEFYCVFEDDVTFVPGMEQKFTHVLSILPGGWGMCFLGHHVWPQHETPDCYDKEKIPRLDKWNAFQSLTYSIGGAVGYLISKAGALAMLEFIEDVGMTNAIDTMQQKAADIIPVYYCMPHLVYSDCWTKTKTVDTDIQLNFRSLDMGKILDIGSVPGRLKKNDVFDITDALIFPESENPIVIAVSDCEHASYAASVVTGQKTEYPFDKIKGDLMFFFEIILRCLECPDKNLLEFAREFCSGGNVNFPSEKVNLDILSEVYTLRFADMASAIKSGACVVLFVVSRWKTVDVDLFRNFESRLRGYNPNIRILSVNCLPSDVEIKGVDSRREIYPDIFRTDEWTINKMVYDRQSFRVNLIGLLRQYLSELNIFSA